LLIDIMSRLNQQQMREQTDFMGQSQRRTGHSSNATLVAGVFIQSPIQNVKKGLLEEFRGPFEFFYMDGRRGIWSQSASAQRNNYRSLAG
jgi:hypothetical protein